MPKAIGKQRADYDATKTGKQRRRPVVEFHSEDGILPNYKRMSAVAIGRDLERNFSPARGILHQLRTNVVGSLGKLQCNVDGGEEAASWFNEVWAKSPDARGDDHWSAVLQNIVASVIREGDCLFVVDDSLIDDSGKMWLWEADQIVNLTDADFRAKFPGHTQDNGIVRDSLGRIVGYFASGKRGLAEVPATDATYYPREMARLCRNPWRLNQGRGVGSILTSANSIQDLYEILAAELASAKRAAITAGYTKRSAATTDYDNPAGGAAYLPENANKAEAETAAESAGGGDAEAPNYERFESLSGGYWEYLAEGDEVGILNLQGRPSVALADFVDRVMGMAGSSMGLAKVYTSLQASTSYTAFRGEMILTWATFYVLQKWLERTVADWVAVKVLNWAMHKGFVPRLPDGWERRLSWVWPCMPEVDELDAENAVKQALKNGTTDYAKLLGPDWRQRLTGLAEQIAEIRRLGLPLSILETVSGAPVETPKQDKSEGDDTI